MTTLIAVYTSDGCVGRCDAKCYNAESDYCECVCGGHNHGKGLQRAIENTREMCEEMVEAYAQRLGLTDYAGAIDAKVLFQIPLFPEVTP